MRERFHVWLRREPETPSRLAAFLLGVILFNIAWDVAWGLVIGDGTLSYSQQYPEILVEMFPVIVVAPTTEELMSRAVPLWLAVNLLPQWMVWLIVLMSSIDFALAHQGSILAKLLFQGVGGVVLCIVFLKCGGMRRVWHTPRLSLTSVRGAIREAPKTLFKPYLSAVVVHAGVNGIYLVWGFIPI